jgi:hypothetical protein
MVMVCCLIYVYPGSPVDTALASLAVPAALAPTAPALSWVNVLLAATLWVYLAALPFAHAGLAVNLYARRRFPGIVQRILEMYTNTFGIIVWRVFSADHTNFLIEIDECRPDGSRKRVSTWGEGLRFGHVAESITVTTLFTTLKYYPGNSALFTDRLLRYARTLPHSPGSTFEFRYVAVVKGEDRFDYVVGATYSVDIATDMVDERVIDASISVRAPVAESPVHEAARPGTYAPAR